MASVLVYTNGKSDRVVKRNNIVYVARGLTGPEGPAGSGFDNLILDGIAGEDLSGHTAVYLSDGAFYHADKDIEEKVLSISGITENAALAGGTVRVVQFGKMHEPTWNWLHPKPIFLGNNGELTLTKPDTGFSVQLGASSSANNILVKIGRIIKLA